MHADRKKKVKYRTLGDKDKVSKSMKEMIRRYVSDTDGKNVPDSGCCS